MRILVVDDEKLLVKGVKFNLENEGYEVECAYDGASAVELARNGRFDLIILDVMMPELDGQEACMRIREFSNVPIIMLTAKSEDADKLMGFECYRQDWNTVDFCPTPEDLLDSLLDAYENFRMMEITGGDRDLTEKEEAKLAKERDALTALCEKEAAKCSS